MKATRPPTPAEKAAATRRKNREREAAKAKAREEARIWNETWPKSYVVCGNPSHPAGTIERMFGHSNESAYVGNGEVRLRKYKITVELVAEPIEVLRERLRKLWRESEKNHHNWDPMRAMARELGMGPDELALDDQGKDHPRRG